MSSVSSTRATIGAIILVIVVGAQVYVKMNPPHPEDHVTPTPQQSLPTLQLSTTQMAFMQSVMELQNAQADYNDLRQEQMEKLDKDPEYQRQKSIMRAASKSPPSDPQQIKLATEAAAKCTRMEQQALSTPELAEAAQRLRTAQEAVKATRQSVAPATTQAAHQAQR